MVDTNIHGDIIDPICKRSGGAESVPSCSGNFRRQGPPRSDAKWDAKPWRNRGSTASGRLAVVGEAVCRAAPGPQGAIMR